MSRLRRLAGRAAAKAGYTRAAPERDGYLTTLHDASTALPEGAADILRADHPRLRELRAAYAALDWPVTAHSRWLETEVEAVSEMAYFRGDTYWVWHYRESKRVSELKYFVWLQDVLRRDTRGLVPAMDEDGAFGCWTYGYPGYPRCSRDVLDSANELMFLDRHLDLFARPAVRIIDVGAGYGRLAHRAAQVVPGLSDYCCVDAVPMSTFVSEYYLGHRRCAPPARAVPLPDVPDLQGAFDLAVNIHSFSECTAAAIHWWLEQLVRLQVPRLFVVPNEPDAFLSMEADGSRLDYLALITGAGYRLTAQERAFEDDAVRELLGIEDRYYLFELGETAGGVSGP